MSEEKGEELWVACQYDEYIEAEKLIDEGADIEYRGRWDWTPLMIASERGNVDIVQLLLDKQANVNNKTNGYTALHGTSAEGKQEIVSLLIERGADLYIKGCSGHTPLDMAKEMRGHFSPDLDDNIQILEDELQNTIVVYTTSDELQNNTVSFKDFDSNVIILTDNNIPDGFLFEEKPVFTLQNIQQCLDQVNTDNAIPANEKEDAINNILSEKYPALLERMQHWEMNLLHLIVSFPENSHGDLHKVLSSLLDKYLPQEATASVDMYGETPLEYSVYNLMKQRKISQKSHDLLLARSSPLVIHRAIEAGMEWCHLLPIVEAKVKGLAMADEETGLLPFMLAAKECDIEGDDEDNDKNVFDGVQLLVDEKTGLFSIKLPIDNDNDDDNNSDNDDEDDVDDDRFESFTMVYELLSMKPDVLKEYDVLSYKVKRALEECKVSSSGIAAKRSCQEA